MLFKDKFIYYNTEIDVEVNLPYNGSIKEYTYILITRYHLPIYVEYGLSDALDKFLNDSNRKYYNDNTDKLVQVAKDGTIDIESITKEWEKLIKKETNIYGEKRCVSDEELFAEIYHKMVHSPALETMFQLEYMYSRTVRQKTEEKNKTIKRLSERQTDEMNKAVDRLEQDMTECKINELVAKHYETQSLTKVKLTSELDTIKEAQRREYREWLMRMLEQKQTVNESEFLSSIPSPTMITNVHNDEVRERNTLKSNPTFEESFTIHLGSQLKQMHNLRILSGNITEICLIENDDKLTEPAPHLLQTALALYSNDLSGLVLMSDNKIGSKSTREFLELCESSTDFHFPHVDEQLNKISSCNKQYSSSDLLKNGDFYITKHSNLAQVHVIFHIVSDDSLRGCDINSRHPVILGLRNILKTACSNDITSLTIPLLLQYETSEEMTVSWCEKRAELVFKCVKGFMIEMASWGGSDLKNLQFVLPKEISPEVFQSLSEMLPRIFKVSNPKFLK